MLQHPLSLRGSSVPLYVNVLVGDALAWQIGFVLLMAALARLHELRIGRVASA